MEIPNQLGKISPGDYFFGRNLKYLRKADKRKLTQDQLGKMIGVSDASISHYEKSKGFPELAGVLKLAQIFEVNLHALFFADLSKDKEESAKADYKYGNKTKAEIEEDIRQLWAEIEAMKEAKNVSA